MLTAMEMGKVVITTGFAAYLLVTVINHIRDFQGTLAFVAGFMQMVSLDQEPAIPSPLKSRRIESPTAHRLALIGITLAQAVFGVLLVVAAWLFVRGDAMAEVIAQYAFAGLMALWFFFIVAGNWFAYWIRLDSLLRTHMLLLGTTMLGFVVVSL